MCWYKNAGVAGYAEAFRPVQSDSQTSEWYSYFENDVLGEKNKPGNKNKDLSKYKPFENAQDVSCQDKAPSSDTGRMKIKICDGQS